MAIKYYKDLCSNERQFIYKLLYETGLSQDPILFQKWMCDQIELKLILFMIAEKL